MSPNNRLVSRVYVVQYTLSMAVLTAVVFAAVCLANDEPDSLLAALSGVAAMIFAVLVAIYPDRRPLRIWSNGIRVVDAGGGYWAVEARLTTGDSVALSADRAVSAGHTVSAGQVPTEHVGAAVHFLRVHLDRLGCEWVSPRLRLDCQGQPPALLAGALVAAATRHGWSYVCNPSNSKRR
ncbi:hypothetical protein [Microbispora sp. NPDC049125]|uniref:hypothetical protein n=1 Tax=Microbispora sp. NPDC049125 TaxID=3154929 RepID=UPI0034675E80